MTEKMLNFLKKYWKKLYRVLVLPAMNQRYIRLPVIFESIVSANPAKLFVVTVAFNDAELIVLQHAALRKHLRDPYEYFVFDNSTDEAKSAGLKEWCLAQGVNYVRLPYNRYRKSIPNASHSFALNWIYRNVILRCRPARFGIWDCDLYPTRPISISPHLDVTDTWGIIRKQKLTFRPWQSGMHVWPGLAFFRLDKFKKHGPNFMPRFGADVGCRMELTPATVARFTDAQYLNDFKITEIAPQTRIERSEGFIHFGGSADFPPGLAFKKKWMAEKLGIAWPLSSRA